MMKHPLILFFAWIWFQNLSAQTIGVGEKLPTQTLDLLQFLDGGSVSSDEHGNKPIIFDFWSTWCTDCLKSMPLIEKIHDEFQDSLSIFLVNSQDVAMVKEFWKNNPVTRSLSISTLVGDYKLKEHFPRKGVPYVAWIASDRTVMHLTHGRYLTRSNVQLFLAGKPLVID